MKFVYVLMALAVAACGGSSADSASDGAGDGRDNADDPNDARASGRGLGPVATLSLVNDGRTTIAARTTSFGQVFRPGAVRPDNTVSMTINGATTPAQLDAKALNSDGSVRHGVITVALPPCAPENR